MEEILATPRLTSSEENLTTLRLPEVSLVTDEQLVAYLRHSYKIAEIAAEAETDALILGLCEQLDITVSDDELQAAGDTFRQEQKLLGASETLAWLAQQRVTVEDWSQGIRVALLTQKLKERLFGEITDTQYLTNRNSFKRVALSQILVLDLTKALKIVQSLRQENASFCTLALEYSKGRQSKENGGFVGVRFLAELLPELIQAVAEAKEGEVLGPIQTKLGYHVLKIEKWFPTEFSQVRENVLEFLFKTWLKSKRNSVSGIAE